MFIFPFLIGGPVGYGALTFLSSRRDVTDYSEDYKGNEKNIKLALSKIDHIIYRKEEKNFFAARSFVILEAPGFFASASAPTRSGKSHILIAPNLIQIDEQAVGFLLKHELAHIKYNDPFMGCVIPFICSLATAILATSTLSVIPATGVTYLTGLTSKIAHARFVEARADDFARQYSTAEELEGAKRFFSLAINSLPHEDMEHPCPQSRLEKIERSFNEKVTKKTKKTRKKDSERMIGELRNAFFQVSLSRKPQINPKKHIQVINFLFSYSMPSQSFSFLLGKLYNYHVNIKNNIQKKIESPVSFFSCCKVARKNGDFHKRYVFLKEIGSGTHSTVFLAKNYKNELLVIKKYKIKEQELLQAISEKKSIKAGLTEASFIRNLAEIEREVGRRTDHPNIMKIREVHLKGPIAYIVMDYVEGIIFNDKQNYPLETRIAFMQQFLSALDHLLSQGILISDLHSENIMVSPEKTHLTLIDFGGYEIVGLKADLSIEEYLSDVEYAIGLIGNQEGEALLEACKHLLPESLREQKISYSHLTLLREWVRALQQELST